MVIGKLDNCSRCDALFVKGLKDVCQKCIKEIEAEYEKCSQFLRKRENRGSTIQQVSDATGISIKQITKFIKEGRISIKGTPNMGYPCDNCDNLILSGNLCESCMSSLKREINQQMAVDRRVSDEERQKRNVGYQSKKMNE